MESSVELHRFTFMDRLFPSQCPLLHSGWFICTSVGEHDGFTNDLVPKNRRQKYTQPFPVCVQTWDTRPACPVSSSHNKYCWNGLLGMSTEYASFRKEVHIRAPLTWAVRSGNELSLAWQEWGTGKYGTKKEGSYMHKLNRKKAV